MILYPQIPAAAQFTLSAFVALALRDTVAQYIDQQVKIKWPNDIFVKDRKIGGILIQNSISGHAIQHAIVGIGLNVNELTFPRHIPNPTSLAIECERHLNLEAVMETLMTMLNSWYIRMQQLPMPHLKLQYASHLYGVHQIRDFHLKANNEVISARINGIDDYGRILLQRAGHDKIESYSLDQIRQIIA